MKTDEAQSAVTEDGDDGEANSDDDSGSEEKEEESVKEVTRK